MRNLIVLAFLTSLTMSCQTIKQQDKGLDSNPSEVTGDNKPTTPTSPTLGRISLSWERSDSSRAKWSDHMMSQINVETYLKASDITKFCPKIKSLTLAQQKKAIGEFWVSLGAKETKNWDPKSASVDVGTEEDKNTWSVGLFQMSVVDQKNYNKDFGFKYADLQKAEPNITLANYIMEWIINRRGAITLEKNVYWAPLRIGGRYDKIADIIERTKKEAPFCL